MPTPTQIRRDGDSSIVIQWSDGKATRWTAEVLRKQCPCATCREKKRSRDSESQWTEAKTLPVLSLQETQPLKITSMRPAGAYAYNIAFSDGHSSGLYPMDLLYRLPEDRLPEDRLPGDELPGDGATRRGEAPEAS